MMPKLPSYADDRDRIDALAGLVAKPGVEVCRGGEPDVGEGEREPAPLGLALDPHPFLQRVADRHVDDRHKPGGTEPGQPRGIWGVPPRLAEQLEGKERRGTKQKET